MFKTDYMASLIATNLYDTAANVHQDFSNSRIDQIKQFRKLAGANLVFAKRVVDAFHEHSRPEVYDFIKEIYLGELDRLEKIEAEQKLQSFRETFVPEPLKKEEYVIFFEYNDFPPYYATSLEEAERVKDLLANTSGRGFRVQGIYKKI